MFCDNAILNMDPGYSIEGTGLPVSIRQAVLVYESFSAFKAIALRWIYIPGIAGQSWLQGNAPHPIQNYCE